MFYVFSSLIRAELKKFLHVTWSLQAVVQYTVKPVYKDHPKETRKAVFMSRWSLWTGFFGTLSTWQKLFKGNKNCGLYRQVVTKAGLTVSYFVSTVVREIFKKICYLQNSAWAELRRSIFNNKVLGDLSWYIFMNLILKGKLETLQRFDDIFKNKYASLLFITSLPPPPPSPDDIVDGGFATHKNCGL